MPVDPTYPVASPTVSSGTKVTVDILLRNPRVVERKIANMVLQKFFVDKIFAPAGEITGGAVLYEQATDNELYASRDVQRIEPGDEYPKITFDRGNMFTAQVEKFGGEFDVPDEVRKRNRLGYVNRRLMILSNTVKRKTQYRAMAELDAAIAAHSRQSAGISWLDATTTTNDAITPSAMPTADLAAVLRANEVKELGYDYNMMIINPAEWANLLTTFGPANLPEVLRGFGITDWWVTNRQTAGTAKFLAQGMVGELGYEQPLESKVYREEKRDTDIVKASVLPVVYVTDPNAILELTGLAA